MTADSLGVGGGHRARRQRSKRSDPNSLPQSRRPYGDRTMNIGMNIAGIISATLLLLWALVTIVRSFRSDSRQSDRIDDLRKQARFRIASHAQLVRFEQIRNREHERMITVPTAEEYFFEEGYSAGLPDDWAEDLFLRRS